VRVATRYLSMLDATGQKEARAKAEAGLRSRWAGSPFLEALPGAAR
jgi:hypothetical protein